MCTTVGLCFWRTLLLQIRQLDGMTRLRAKATHAMVETGRITFGPAARPGTENMHRGAPRDRRQVHFHTPCEPPPHSAAFLFPQQEYAMREHHLVTKLQKALSDELQSYFHPASPNRSGAAVAFHALDGANTASIARIRIALPVERMQQLELDL